MSVNKFLGVFSKSTPRRVWVTFTRPAVLRVSPLMLEMRPRKKTQRCAALVSPWSKGEPKGEITKLKTVKRPMYGRAKSNCFRHDCSMQLRLRLVAGMAGSAAPKKSGRHCRTPASRARARRRTDGKGGQRYTAGEIAADYLALCHDPMQDLERWLAEDKKAWRAAIVRYIAWLSVQIGRPAPSTTRPRIICLRSGR